jgi:hypothetical protein
VSATPGALERGRDDSQPKSESRRSQSLAHRTEKGTEREWLFQESRARLEHTVPIDRVPCRKRSAGFVRLSSQLVTLQGSAPRPFGDLALQEAEVEPPLPQVIPHRHKDLRVGAGRGLEARSVKQQKGNATVSVWGPG